ncbi:MAG: hypothetical protein IIB73_00630 [Proteobacteria bacterium]|nr:hypothetical protein [Pseudomonadota bacterium]
MNTSNPLTTGSHRALLIFFILLLLFSSGCTQSLAIKVTSEVPAPLINQIPLNIGVYYDEQFSHHVYRENSEDRPNWTIESGSSQVALFDQVLPSMFKQVQHVTSIDLSANISKVDAVLAPHIEEMQFALPRETQSGLYEVWIKYNIQLYSPDGSLIADWPLTAYGKSSVEFLKNRSAGLQAAIEVALRDVGAKLALGFGNVIEIKQWLADTIGECENYAVSNC